MKQFQQTGMVGGLEDILPSAKEHSHLAAELEILLTIIPTHINNPVYPINNLIEEWERTWKLCGPLLEGLNPKPNQPCGAETIKQIEEFFQVAKQSNPGMKVVLRVDWLSPEYYQQSASKPHQFELREEIFAEKATEYLGRLLVSQMLGIFDRKFESGTLVPLSQKFDTVLKAMGLIEEVLTVSFTRFLYLLFD
jgi:hypothetical protein